MAVLTAPAPSPRHSLPASRSRAIPRPVPRAPAGSLGRTPAACPRPTPTRYGPPCRNACSTAGIAASSLCSCSGCCFDIRADHGEEPCRVPRVLAQDDVGRPQHCARPRRQVTKVADWRGNQHKTIRQGGRSLLRGSGDVAHASSGIRAPSRHSITRRRAAGASTATVAAYGGPPVALGSAQPGAAPLAAGPAGQRVAILLPLSGPRADIGQPMLQAAQLAMDAQGGPPLDVKDTAGTPDGAAAAARAAVADGVGLILGPLTSAETAAVAPIARQANVAVLAFTNDPSQAQPGVWTLGITPGQQVRRLVAADNGAGQVAVRRPAARHRFRPRHGSGADAGDSREQRRRAQYPVLRVRHVGHQRGRAGRVRLRQPAWPDRGADASRPRVGHAGRTPAGPGTSRRRRSDRPPSTFCCWRTPAWPWRRSPRCCRITTCFADRYRLSAHRCGRRRRADPASSAAPGMPRRIRPRARRFVAGVFSKIRWAAAAPGRSGVRRRVDRAGRDSGRGNFSVGSLTQEAGFLGADGWFALQSDGQVRRALAVFSIERGGPQMQEPAPQSGNVPGA